MGGLSGKSPQGHGTLGSDEVPPSGGGGGGFPGFGGAPPAIATSSAAGVAATASRSDHTHALDLVVYTPSRVAMQATGVIQQTFAAGSATPTTTNIATSRIPLGNAGVLTTSANLNFNATTSTLLVGNGLSADPFGGLTKIGSYSNVNNDAFAFVAANANAVGAAVSTSLVILAGSNDGSVGANLFITVNGPAAAAGIGGPQLGEILHTPNVAAQLWITNAGPSGSDIVFFCTPSNIEQLRIVNGGPSFTGELRIRNLLSNPVGTHMLIKSGLELQLQTVSPGGGAIVFSPRGVEAYHIDAASGIVNYGGGAGLTPAGAVAVAITNAPAGVGGAPVEYLKVFGTGSATRYIPLLG